MVAKSTSVWSARNAEAELTVSAGMGSRVVRSIRLAMVGIGVGLANGFWLGVLGVGEGAGGGVVESAILKFLSSVRS